MPRHLVLVIVDGLRADALTEALAQGRLPTLARLLGPERTHGLVERLLAPAPSVTFAAQASLITGAHPREHDVPGNQFFDRFGVHNYGKPRHFAFDMGDTLELDDALAVFSRGLATRCLGARTLYERLGHRGYRSAVFGHMYGNGADHWAPLPTSLLARLGRGPLPLPPEALDQWVVDQAVTHIQRHGLPQVLTVYLLGLDYFTHEHGPQAQGAYLARTVDPLLKALHQAVSAHQSRSEPPLWVVVGDHGQRDAPGDEAHALRLAFPRERDLAPLFQALHLDALDYPGEGPRCDAVLAANGHLAFIYLRTPHAPWQQPPDFNDLVLPLARLCWQAHRTGQPAAALRGALAGVFVRRVERDGWHAPYQALTPEGDLIPLEAWFDRFPPGRFVDPVARLHAATGPLSGDILLLADEAAGYHFGPPHRGMHGGLDEETSWTGLAVAWPQADSTAWQALQQRWQDTIRHRCAHEGGRLPTVADLVPALESVLR